MKIGIDISQTAYPGSGVARYTSTLIESLSKYDSQNEYILFFSSLRGNIPRELKQITDQKKNFVLKRFYLPPTILDILWNRLHIAPIEWFIGKVDIFLTSDWVEPSSTRTKKITTIHDLVIYKFPETCSAKIIDTQKRRLNWVTKESELIMCDSEATKKDVEEILKIDPKKLSVVYPAVEIKKTENPEYVKKTYHLNQPFILTVGKVEPRKNIVKLIEAFQMTQIKDADLVIVGTKGWGRTNFNVGTGRDLSLQNVKFLGFVPDKDLYALYQQAEFFVYPSLYEGFGYPVVEAMSLGCPVATSNNSSLAEIVENNGILFDPQSTDSIASAILKYYQDKNFRREMSTRGLERAIFFSTENFAKKLLKIIRS